MTAPLLVAAVDIGSNAIRLAIAAVSPGKEPEIVLFQREAVRLGHSVFDTGSVGETALDSAETAMRSFRGILGERDIRIARAVATSALRTAINGPEVTRRLALALGMPIAVIDAMEEARLVAVAMQARVGPPSSLDLVVDLGGGSSQWSLITPHKVAWSGSFPIGAVRLHKALAENVDHPEDEFLDRWLAPALADLAAARRTISLADITIERLILSGGNAETLSDLATRLHEARRLGTHSLEALPPGTLPLGRKHEQTLSASDLSLLVERIAAEPAATRESAFQLPPNRADVIIPAARLFLRLMSHLEFSSALVPRAGLKEGILVELRDLALAGPGSAGKSSSRQGEHQMPSDQKSVPIAEPQAPASIQDLADHYARSLDRGARRYTRWVRRLRKDPGGRAIHTIRIASRRIVALLDLAAEAWSEEGEGCRIPREQARALRRELAEARDLQASLNRLADLAVAGLPAQVLARLLEDQLASALEIAARAGGRKKSETIAAPLDDLVERLTSGKGPSPASLVVAMQRSLLDRRGNLLDAVANLDEEDPVSLHTIRIALKKYRYAAEILEPFLTAEAAAELETLSELQSHLGAVQDLETLRIRVENLVGSPDDSSSMHAETWNVLQREQEERIAEACERIEGLDLPVLPVDKLLRAFISPARSARPSRRAPAEAKRSTPASASRGAAKQPKQVGTKARKPVATRTSTNSKAKSRATTKKTVTLKKTTAKSAQPGSRARRSRTAPRRQR